MWYRWFLPMTACTVLPTVAVKLGLTSCLSLLLLAITLACGGSENVRIEPQEVPTSTPSPMAVDGPIWVLEILNGDAAIEGTVLTLSISGASAGGSDGCNGFGGRHEDGSPVAGADGSISFPGFTQTLALCEYPLGTVAQQDDYLAALADSKQYQVQDHRLQIRDGFGNLRLVMVNKSPLVGTGEDLTSTAWRLVSTDGKAPKGRPPTLAFWDQGFRGRYRRRLWLRGSIRQGTGELPRPDHSRDWGRDQPGVRHP